MPLKPGQDPWETIAPSPMPFGTDWHMPRAATLADIARVRDGFVNSAKRAVRIGFDAIELHYAHGYLAHSFLSPVSNHRTDQYGGSLENRMRLRPRDRAAVREVVPKIDRARRAHHRQRLARRRPLDRRRGDLFARR